MKTHLHKLFRKTGHRAGQSITEYAVILALIAMLAVLMLRGIGTTTNNSLVPVNNALQ